MPVPLSYKVRKYRYQLFFIFVFVTLIYHFHHSSSASPQVKSPVQVPASNPGSSEDYDPARPAGAAKHQPAPPSTENVKIDGSKPPADADKKKNLGQDPDVDVDKVPVRSKKPLDPPPFKNDKPGFKEDDVPTDYSMKDDNLAVAPKPPGAGSGSSSPKAPAGKNDPPPKLGLGTKEGPAKEAQEALPPIPEQESNIAADFSPNFGGAKFQVPSKEDFLNLDIVPSSQPSTRMKAIKNKILELLPRVKKIPRTDKHPVKSVIPLPTPDPSVKIPKIQADTFTKLSGEQEQARLKRLATIKEAFVVSWKQYKEFAWGRDEIKPISNEGIDPFAGWAATLVDALDTLIIMDLKEEFAEALEVVKTIDFSTTFRRDIPLFETVIRYLGGLLSAYDLSSPKERVLLDKAIELGDNLMGAFDTPNRMPRISFLWSDTAQKYSYRASSASPFAEVGSLSVEFTRLAQLTGNSAYFDAIDRITTAIYEMAPNNDIPYLFDQKVDASGCKISPLPASAQAAEEEEESVQQTLANPRKPHKPNKQRSSRDPLSSFLDADDIYDDDDEYFGASRNNKPLSLKDEETQLFKRAVVDFEEKEQLAKGVEILPDDDDEAELAKPKIPAKPVAAGADEEEEVTKAEKPAKVASKAAAVAEEEETETPAGAKISKSDSSFKAAVEPGVVVEEDEELKAQHSSQAAAKPSASAVTPADLYSTEKDVKPVKKAAVEAVDENELLGVKLPKTKENFEDMPVVKSSEPEEFDEEVPASNAPKSYDFEDVPTKAQKASLDETAQTPLDLKKVIHVFENGRSSVMACEEQPALARFSGMLRFTSNGFFETFTNNLDSKTKPKYTVGGLTDSTYEYYAKEYLMLQGADERYKTLHTGLIEAVNEHLVFKPQVEGDPDILFVGNKIQISPDYLQEDNEMSHLSCFVGGMYAMGGKIFDRPEDVEIGAKLTEGCVWAYNATRTGVMPENFHVRRCPAGEEDTCTFEFETVDKEVVAREKLVMQDLKSKGVDTKGEPYSTYLTSPEVDILNDGRGGSRWPVSGYYDMPRSFIRMDAKYIMRPEALESVFYMYRISGDPVWQDRGWDMISSILKLTAIHSTASGVEKVVGYSGVNDVSDDRGTKHNFRDEVESFWMAETLKYAYLLYSDPDLISLDDFVFNTEAHPLSRPTKSRL